VRTKRSGLSSRENAQDGIHEGGLPTPGPPVITITFDRTRRGSLSFCRRQRQASARFHPTGWPFGIDGFQGIAHAKE